MRTPIDKRQTFTFELGHLVRTVRRRDGGEYRHRCSLDSFREVAFFIEHHADEGSTSGDIWQGLRHVACTQASVAVAFLKERGCIEARHRRLFPTSRCLFEDAMIEFHALEHQCKRTSTN